MLAYFLTAESARFELAIPFRVYHLSKVAHSATMRTLHSTINFFWLPYVFAKARSPLQPSPDSNTELA